MRRFPSSRLTLLVNLLLVVALMYPHSLSLAHAGQAPGIQPAGQYGHTQTSQNTDDPVDPTTSTSTPETGDGGDRKTATSTPASTSTPVSTSTPETGDSSGGKTPTPMPTPTPVSTTTPETRDSGEGKTATSTPVSTSTPETGNGGEGKTATSTPVSTSTPETGDGGEGKTATSTPVSTSTPETGDDGDGKTATSTPVSTSTPETGNSGEGKTATSTPVSTSTPETGDGDDGKTATSTPVSTSTPETGDGEGKTATSTPVSTSTPETGGDGEGKTATSTPVSTSTPETGNSGDRQMATSTPVSTSTPETGNDGEGKTATSTPVSTSTPETGDSGDGKTATSTPVSTSTPETGDDGDGKTATSTPVSTSTPETGNSGEGKTATSTPVSTSTPETGDGGEGPAALSVEIVSSPADGAAYTVGEVIEVAVTFSGPVKVTGQPLLGLAVGDTTRWAMHTSLFRQRIATLYFAYAVSDDDADDDGVSVPSGALDLNGGAIEDESGVAADLTLPALPDQEGHGVAGVSFVKAQPLFLQSRSGGLQSSSTSTNDLKPEITGPSGPVTKHFYVRVLFPRKVGGMALDDAVVTNGRLLLFQSNAHPDPLSVDYTYGIMPTGDGDVTFQIRAGAARDANDVESVASDTFTVQADITRPSLSIESDASPGPVTGAFDIEFNFTESVTGLDVRDVEITNGAISNLKADNPQKGYASKWTATVTPSATGAVIVHVPAESVLDRVGHSNEASPNFNMVADLTHPTPTIATTTTTVDGPFSVTITFSEPVKGLTKDDIDVTKGRVASLTGRSEIGDSGEANAAEKNGFMTTWDASIVPEGNGDVTLMINAGAVVDQAGKASLVSNRLTVQAPEGPTVTLTADPGPVKGGFVVTVTFGGPVTLVSATSTLSGSNLNPDITYALAPVNGQSPPQEAYSVTVYPAESGEVRLSIPAGAAHDLGGHANLASEELVVLADLDPPTATLTGPAEKPTGPFDITVQFSEPVTNLIEGSFNVTNGTVKSVLAQESEDGYATSWTVNVRPAATGTTTVELKVEGPRDRAGNGNATTSSVAVAAVVLPLTATITVDDKLPPAIPASYLPEGTRAVKGRFKVTITFSEPVTGLSTSSVSFPAINGKGRGTAIAVTAVNPENGYAAEWTATITPSPDLSSQSQGFGLVDVSLGADAARDVDGRGNAAAEKVTVKYVRGAPTVSGWIINTTVGEEYPFAAVDDIREHIDDLRGGFLVRAVFSVPVGMASLDEFITIENGKAVAIRKREVWSWVESADILVLPEVSGPIRITIGRPGSFWNDAGTRNEAGQRVTLTMDLPPVVRMAGPDGPVKEEFTVQIEFVENVNGFEQNDIEVTNGDLTEFTKQGVGTSTTWFAKVRPTETGTTTIVTVEVVAGAATSTVDGEQNATTTFSVLADLDRPTVEVSSSSTSTVSEVFEVAIRFSEPVSGLEAGELQVTNGVVTSLTASNPDDAGRAALWNAKIAPSANGAVTVTVPKDVAVDVVGWTNTASDVYSRTADGVVRPTANIVPNLEDPQLGLLPAIGSPEGRENPFYAAVTFSKPVTGLKTGHFTIDNGTASGLQAVDAKDGYASEWSLGFAPTKAGKVTISLNAGVVRDRSGLANLAAEASVRANLGRPTLKVTEAPDYWLSTSSPFTISVEFSEPVAIASLPLFVDFIGASPENLRGVAVEGLATSTGPFYTSLSFDVRPDPGAKHVSGLVGEAGRWWDDGGNLGGDGQYVRFQIDTTPPTVTISKEGNSDPVNGVFNARIEFSEPVSLKDETKVTVSNGTFTLGRHPTDANNSLYLARLTPDGDGDVVLTLGEGAFVDRVGQTHQTASFTETASLPPRVALSTDATHVSADFDVTVTFSEPVTGFDETDLAVTNGVAKAVATTTDVLVYTATITPTTAASRRHFGVTVQLPAGSVTDAMGNPNVESHTLTVSAVILGPIPTIAGPAGPEDGAFEIVVEFDREVSGFDVDDLELGNATATSTQANQPDPIGHWSRTYHYTITPVATGWVTVDVPAGAATSTSEHESSRARQYRVWADPNPPAVTLRVANEVPVGQKSFDVFIEFSEEVVGLDLGAASEDVVVTNGEHAGITRTGENVYVTRVTATADGEVKITVPANAVRDEVGHANAEASLTVTADVPPSVTITSTSTEPVPIDENLVVTITFSEPVTGFDILDVVVQRGNALKLEGSGAVYTLTIEPTGAERGCFFYDPKCGPYDRVGVKVPAGAARDASGNRSLPGEFSTQTNVDPYRPTVRIRRVEPHRVHGLDYDTCGLVPASDQGPVTGPFFLEFVTSAAAGDYNQNDLDLTNARILSWTPMGELVQWCAKVEPLASGQVVVTSPRGAFGTEPHLSVKKTFQIDAELTPEATISSDATSPVHDAFEIDIKFSYPVTGFTVGDLKVTNGQASNFAVATSTIATTTPDVYATGYTATITPTESGTTTVKLPAGAAQDVGDVGNAEAEPFEIEANINLPTAVISGPTGPVNGIFEVRITFNKVVSGLRLGDLVVETESTQAKKIEGFYAQLLRDADGKVVDGEEGQEFRATIVPKPHHRMRLHSSVFVTVSLPAGTVEDDAGRKSQEQARYKVEADLQNPKANVALNATSTITGAFNSTITFTEPVCDMKAEDVFVSHGAAVTGFTPDDSGSDDCLGLRFEVIVTPSRSGNVWVFVPEGAAWDRARNSNQYGFARGQMQVVQVQLQRPGTSIEGPTGPVGPGKFDIAIEFSADVTGFEASDITVGNGALSEFATTSSASRYTASVAPATDGYVTLDVPEGVATVTGATTTNMASPQFKVLADLTGPAVSISGPSTSTPQNSAFDIKIVFSEVSTGLTADEVKVGNGAASEFALTDPEKTPGRTEYTATVTPEKDGVVTVDVGADVAQDTLGNLNTAAPQLKVTADLTAPTVTVTGSTANRVGGRNYAAGPFTVTFTFSEPVTGLDTDEIRVANGVVTALTGEGNAYTATVAPSATDVWVEVTVPKEVAEDTAGNLNLASPTFFVRSEPPLKVELHSSARGLVATTFPVVVKFSTDVTGFTLDDLDVVNATTSNLRQQSPLGSDEWTVDVKPKASGLVTVDVPAAVVKGKYANNDNEAAEQFSIRAYVVGKESRRVDENTPAATDLGDPVTTSSTSTKAHALGGADAASFDIATSTGQLKTRAALDYETRREYEVTVTVTEGGEVTAVIGVFISVNNVNEPPVITGVNSVSHPENATSPVATYTATDPDSDSLAWSLTGTDAGHFDIDDDGVLTFNSPPDYEDPRDAGEDNTYDLTVNVSDGNGGSDTLDVAVEVTDVDLAIELITLLRVSGDAAVSYAENGTSSVATYTADGPASDGLAWTLTGTDAGHFGIDDDGVLTFKSPPDYEVPRDAGGNNTYDLTVNVAVGSASSTLDVAVTVIDVDEPPRAVNDTAATTENTAVDVKVLRNDTDPEKAALRVSYVSGPANGTAAIKNAAGGVVTYTPNANFNGPDSFTYIVSDGTNTAEAAVVVIVAPANDPPTLSGEDEVSYAENGTGPVAQYTATDPESDSLAWSLTGTDAGLFGIGDDGVLTFNSPPDYEDPKDAGADNVYNLAVEVADGNGGTASLSVTVTVTDVNEVAPKASDDVPVTTVNVNVPVTTVNVNVPLTPVTPATGAPVIAGDDIVYYAENDTVPVATYTASGGESDSLAWSLTGTDAGLFGIDDGVLTFNAPPDYENPKDAGADNTYDLTVNVADGSDRSGSLAITVIVTDVSEAVRRTRDVSGGGVRTTTDVDKGPVPVTRVTPRTATRMAVVGDDFVDYAENATSAVATYTASGGESDSLTWTLTGPDAGLFGIDADGVLRFKMAPDYEAPEDAGADNTYNLKVNASDGERGDDMAVVIRVTNVDEDGTVTLSSTEPRIGEPLTASLSDPDGAVSDVAWQWSVSRDKRDWRPVAGATEDSYTPVDGDVGSYLRARAFYTDAEGADKRAERATDDKLVRESVRVTEESPAAALTSMGKKPGSTISILSPAEPVLTQPKFPSTGPVNTPDSPQVAPGGAQQDGILGGDPWPWLNLAILAAIAILLLLLFLLWRRSRGEPDDGQGADLGAA